ncbi:MAG TPA: glycosyltransferase family 4 protein [Acidimicrobiales bacterium]|nr:glycosyltransferase family 4 protein [Acidimicrobiales bacterium]
MRCEAASAAEPAEADESPRPADSLRPRHVLLVSENAYLAGAETSTLLAAETMAGRGIDVTLAFAGRRGPMARVATEKGLKLLPGAARRTPGPLRAPLISRAATSGSFDLVHVSHLGPRCERIARSALVAGLPVVAHLRVPSHVPVARSLRQAGAFVVTNSTATADQVGAPGMAVRFIPNGIDSGGFPQPIDRSQVRSDLGIPDTAVLGLVVANFHWFKGLDLLVPIVLDALEKDPKLHVAHAGGATYTEGRNIRRALIAQAAASPAGSRLHFLGSRPDVPALMSAADFTIVPSRGEGTARVVLEAWATGRAVVGATAGGITDLLEEGVTGRLIDMEDATASATTLVEVASDPGQRERLGRAGRQRVTERYSLDAHVDALLEVYESAFQARADRP